MSISYLEETKRIYERKNSMIKPKKSERNSQRFCEKDHKSAGSLLWISKRATKNYLSKPWIPTNSPFISTNASLRVRYRFTRVDYIDQAVCALGVLHYHLLTCMSIWTIREKKRILITDCWTMSRGAIKQKRFLSVSVSQRSRVLNAFLPYYRNNITQSFAAK